MKKAQKENLVIGLLVVIVLLLLMDICASLYSKKHRWYRKHANEDKVLPERGSGVFRAHEPVDIDGGENVTSLAGSATYFIDGIAYTLRDGKYYSESEEDGTDQVQLVTATSLDGTKDIAVWLKQYTGGSGVFWYVGLARHVNGFYVGGNVIFMGDRITPGEVSLQGDTLVVVEYLDRAYGEAMVAVPSVPTKKIILREAFSR